MQEFESFAPIDFVSAGARREKFRARQDGGRRSGGGHAQEKNGKGQQQRTLDETSESRCPVNSVWRLPDRKSVV